MTDKTRGQRKQERERRKGEKKKRLWGKSTKKGKREREKRRMEDREREREKKKTDNLLRYLLTNRENNRKHNIIETAATTNICINRNTF